MKTKIIVVTPLGPCFVPAEVAEEILQKKRGSARFSKKILLFLTIFEGVQATFDVIDGKIPEVDSFEEFAQRFLGDRDLDLDRNILL